MDEIIRIKDVYAKRDVLGKGKLYSIFNPSALFHVQQRERAIISLLKQNRSDDLSNKRILDMGCGTGNVLRDFIRYGASPKNLCGFDLLPDRIALAKERSSSHIDFLCGNAENLPYVSASFDIVLLFTVFTSILDTAMKKNVASEALRASSCIRCTDR